MDFGDGDFDDEDFGSQSEFSEEESDCLPPEGGYHTWPDPFDSGTESSSCSTPSSPAGSSRCRPSTADQPPGPPRAAAAAPAGPPQRDRWPRPSGGPSAPVAHGRGGSSSSSASSPLGSTPHRVAHGLLPGKLDNPARAGAVTKRTSRGSSPDSSARLSEAYGPSPRASWWPHRGCTSVAAGSACHSARFLRELRAAGASPPALRASSLPPTEGGQARWLHEQWAVSPSAFRNLPQPLGAAGSRHAAAEFA